MVQDAEKYKTEDEEARRKVCWRGGSARPLRMCRFCMELFSGSPLVPGTEEFGAEWSCPDQG